MTNVWKHNPAWLPGPGKGCQYFSCFLSYFLSCGRRYLVSVYGLFQIENILCISGYSLTTVEQIWRALFQTPLRTPPVIVNIFSSTICCYLVLFGNYDTVIIFAFLLRIAKCSIGNLCCSSSWKYLAIYYRALGSNSGSSLN